MGKFKVAICGGGISGLTLAIAFHRYAPRNASIAIDIYEGDPEVRTAGAGITVWPRTWAVVRQLGLYDDLARVAVQSGAGSGDDSSEHRPAFVARKANQPSEGHTFARVLAPSGSTTMHRRDMIDVFLRHLPPSCTLHTSKRLLRYIPAEGDSPIVLQFADGATAETDLLLGADGVHSATRTCMYESAHRNECVKPGGEETPIQHCARCSATFPTWTGVHAYRSLLPTAKLYSINPSHTTASIKAILCCIAHCKAQYSGKGNHIITYQISGGELLNFVVLSRVPDGEGTPHPGKWVIEVSRDEIISLGLDGWEQEVQEMLQCVESPTRWAIHVVENLPFAVSGRVALVGDAMHAMPPNFGAGGGQSIEDAYILGRLLADPRVSLAHVPAVLQIYERIRLPFANDVSRRGRDVGLMYEFNAPGYYDGTSSEDEIEQLDRLGEAIHKMWEWQWTEDVEEQWVQAEKELAGLLGNTKT